jgi:hypothetical protein
MIKAKEIFIIMGCLTVIVAGLWFWVYFRPSQNRVSELRIATEERYERLNREQMLAEFRRASRDILYEQLEYSRVEWEVIQADLPVTFSDTEVLRHIQRNIYRHTDNIQLEFGTSMQRPEDELYSTIVSLAFTTTYWEFLTILYRLVEGEEGAVDSLGNRIVTYDITSSEIYDMDEFITRIQGVAEFMPTHIFEQVQQVVLGGAVDFTGLYMLQVTMEVEYLSLEPGLLSEPDIRGLWNQIHAE